MVSANGIPAADLKCRIRLFLTVISRSPTAASLAGSELQSRWRRSTRQGHECLRLDMNACQFDNDKFKRRAANSSKGIFEGRFPFDPVVRGCAAQRTCFLFTMVVTLIESSMYMHNVAGVAKKQGL